MAAILVCSRAGENLIEGKLKTGLRKYADSSRETVRAAAMPLYPLPLWDLILKAIRRWSNKHKKKKLLMIFPLSNNTVCVFKERVIFVGFPNWWGAIRGSWRVLKDHHFDGKIIFPLYP